MTETARVRWGPTVHLGIIGAVCLAALGLFFSRPDVAALGLPLALWSTLVLRRGREPLTAAVSLEATQCEEGELGTFVRVDGDAEIVELFLVQSQRRARRLLVPSSAADIISCSRVLHSGPVLAVQASVRGLGGDGAVFATASAPVADVRDIAPDAVGLDELPMPRHLKGMHGAHEGRRPGQGGDFRDIHPFVPGDELRRVDWRATARAARGPGDLLVRRTNTLSDASVVIAMDTAEDFGRVVAAWGTGDLERSGVTSLDRAREAARSIASSAIAAGDRVALHVLLSGGRSMRSGSGARHLARLEAVIAAVGQANEDAGFRRTPPVPHGSVIFVLSAFFEGAAERAALTWRATGHRVVAVDILPDLDRTRLSREQTIALRTVLAERENVFADLRTAGVDVVAWSEHASSELRAAARSRL